MEKTFGELVREARLGKKLTLEELAEKINSSKAYLHKIETRDEIPNKEFIVELCRILGLSQKKMTQMAIEAKIEEYKKQITKKYKI